MAVKTPSWQSMGLKGLYHLALGMVGAALVVSLWQWWCPPPRLATVRLKALVQAFVATQAKSGAPQPVIQAHIHQFSQQLETTLRQVADTDHVVLLAQPAVVAGARNYTAVVVHALTRRLATTPFQAVTPQKREVRRS